MHRASILAIAAVLLVGCDEGTETAGQEGEADVAVVEEDAAETVGAEDGTAAPEEPVEQTAEATEEGAETAEQTAGATEETAGADEDTTVLTSESPAVETEVVTEPEMEEEQQAAQAETGQAGTGQTGAGQAGEPAGAAVEGGTEGETADAATGTETGETDLAAAPEETEQVSTTREGDLQDAMQSYRQWAVGRWAEPGNCEAGAVVMQENSISLPGGVTCDDVQVSDAGADSLAIIGNSCQGATDVEEVELEVTQTADGVNVSRGGEQTQLTRCQ